MANSYILGNNLIVTGSITASEGFYGDGSGLTNITASNEWDGSRNGDASITGSFIVSGSGAIVDFTNITSSLGTTTISGSLTITGSLSNGFGNITSGQNSHAQGFRAEASGDYSHAEGVDTEARGDNSHAEGRDTVALGFGSHAEGFSTVASGSFSHAEGTTTIASAYASHAEGDTTVAQGSYSHAEGGNTLASASYSHAEGYYTTASGNYSHAEGRSTIASGSYSHAEGQSAQAIGVYSHAEGSNTIASGNYSHAEGQSTQAIGNYSHAEGGASQASGSYSHAEGINTRATGLSSHAEGSGAKASGGWSHAEGSNTTAVADGSHAEGSSTMASSSYSHTEGLFTIAKGDYQHVQGQYNITSSAQSAFIIGNGTDDISRSNLVFASGSQVQVTGSLNVQGPANITSNVTVTGSLKVQQGITGSLLGTASYALSSVALPAGTDKQVQFNNAGTLNGAVGLTYEVTTDTLNQGNGNTVDNLYAYYSHVEGLNNTVKAIGAHAEGYLTKAYGDYSHTEGISTATGTEKAYYVHQVVAGKVFFNAVYGNLTSKYSIGNYIQISAPGAGVNVIGTVLGRNYIAGVGTIVTSSLSTNLAPFVYNIYSINASTLPSGWTGDALMGATAANTQGESVIATGGSSHAEGSNTLATGYAAHAEGYYSKALESYSHAEGVDTKAVGIGSHAEGYGTAALGNYSHAEGFLTIAAGNSQHVQGQYNITSSAQSAFIVGNGTGPDNLRSNLVFASGSQVQVTGSLLVTGSTTVVGGITGSLLGTASFADLAYAIPGGTGTQMQYNDNGVLAGTTGLLWNPLTTTLNGKFSGDGSQLTGLVSPTAQTATSASHAIQADNATTVTGYNHIEPSPATTWTITHNLGNQFPIVQVYNTDSIMIVPEVVQGLNTNTVVIEFSFAMAGYARIL